MASVAQFRIQHVATRPRGWRVRTKRHGAHELRIAFPPGKRKGSGQLLEILHPKGERNPSCTLAGKNPAELVIFGNPSKAVKKNARRGNNHKPGCSCPICKNMRGAKKLTAKMPKPVRGVFDRNPKRKRRRRNQDESSEAVKLYQAFHGKDPQGIVEKHVSAAVRMEYTALGKLLALGIGRADASGDALVQRWEKQPHINFEGDGITLASSPDGAQLYCIGGNQNLENCLARFGVDESKDLIDVGDCGFVVYEARKAQGGYEPVEYVHKFAEEKASAELPRLIFDKLRKMIFFAGGEYRVEAPGIIN
ncbi:MAG TPA: hypothetical protein VN788_00160 [Verrucomicrobiae bacterium]|nr:hypothetical protein [Verrucomicrobiae bacterium]